MSIVNSTLSAVNSASVLKNKTPPMGAAAESVAGKIKLSAVHAAAKLFKDPQNAHAKTPISLLQELCSKSLLTAPIYELVSAEGQTHAPTFEYRCHLTNEWVATGRGSSKKRAKHAAAWALLNMVRERNTGVNDAFVEALNNLM